jgi:heptosyltransferase-3
MKLRGNEKILIVRHDRLGDLVLTLPVAYVLKKIYPHIYVDILSSSYNSSILKYAAYVDNSISIDNDHGMRKSSGEIADEINRGRYDIIIFARPDLPTAFASFLAGIPIRIGTSRRAYSFMFNRRVDLPRRHSYKHEVDLNLMLLEPLALTPAPGTLSPVLEAKPNRGMDHILGAAKLEDDFVIVHPGSGGSAPNWPEEYYRELIRDLGANIKVVLTGQGKFDIDTDGMIINLMNATSFDELMSVISRCRLLISGSTGPLHIAAALGRPVLGLYPDHPVLGVHRWGPRGKYAEAISPDKQNGHKCRINDKGTCECMESISVGRVLRKALDIMGIEET